MGLYNLRAPGPEALVSGRVLPIPFPNTFLVKIPQTTQAYDYKGFRAPCRS
jgi:hypothetical protein